MRFIVNRSLGQAIRRCATQATPQAAASGTDVAASTVGGDDATAAPTTATAPRRIRMEPTFVTFVAEHSRMRPEELSQLPPERQVVLAIMYLRMTHALKQNRNASINLPWLSATRLVKVFQLAVTAIVDRRVPLSLAVKLLRSQWGRSPPTALQGCQREIRDSLIAWVTELILENKLTVDQAVDLLPIARFIPRNASIIGTIVEKVLAGPSPTAENLINVLFAIRDGKVNPPHSTLDNVLQKILVISNSFTTRQIYRTAVAASSIQYPLLVRLTPMLVRAWSDMAAKAALRQRKPSTRIAAQRRLHSVTSLTVNELATFTRVSAAVGLRYGSTLAALALPVVVPLIRFVRAVHLSVLLRSLSLSQCHDPAVYQAVANKLTQRGPAHPLTMLHLRQVLRAVAAHPDLYRCMRIGGLLEILVSVSHRCGVLRQMQILHFSMDAYQLTRRFSRDANVVSVMSKVVDQFCFQQLRMMRIGVAHLDIVNHTLEVTIMLGMRKAPTSYPGMTQLLKLRNEVYAGVEADGVSARYRALQHGDVFALYHQILAVNQHCGLFRLDLTQTAFKRLGQRINSSCALHVLHALRLYGLVNGRHLPLVPRVEHFVAMQVRKKFARTNARDASEGKERFRELLPPAYDSVTVRHFLSVIQRSQIASLRNDPTVIDGVVSVAMEFGDEETKKLALIVRDSYYAEGRRTSAPTLTVARPQSPAPAVAEATA